MDILGKQALHFDISLHFHCPSMHGLVEKDVSYYNDKYLPVAWPELYYVLAEFFDMGLCKGKAKNDFSIVLVGRICFSSCCLLCNC